MKQLSDQGSSLIESLLVVVMVGIIIILLANLPNAFSLINKSKHVSLAREIIAKQMEDKRSVGFTNLANDNSPILDSRINLLPKGEGNVVVEDCNPDICTNEEAIKVVTITVNWQENKPQTISSTTFIGEGGID